MLDVVEVAEVLNLRERGMFRHPVAPFARFNGAVALIVTVRLTHLTNSRQVLIACIHGANIFFKSANRLLAAHESTLVLLTVDSWNATVEFLRHGRLVFFTFKAHAQVLDSHI